MEVKLSKKQRKAIEMIESIEKYFGVRWFIQAELPGITLHTMDALVSKNVLVREIVNDMPYYKYKGHTGI